MGGKIGNPQIRGKVAARSLPPSMLGVRSLVLPPSKLEVMSRGRSVAAVHGVKSQLSIAGGDEPRSVGGGGAWSQITT